MMNITFGSHSIFSRQGVACFIFAILISTSCMGGLLEAPAKNTVTTRFGTLRLHQSGDDIHCTASLLYNGKSIWKSDCSASSIEMSQEAVFSLSNQDILIISEVVMGNAGVISFTAVVLDQKKTPKVLKHEDFVVEGSMSVSPKIVGNHLEVDLGFAKKLRKIVKIEGESLTISYEKPASVQPLTQDTCSWLYSDVLKECSTSLYARDCIYNNNDIYGNHSGAVGRGLVELNNDPAFDLKKFHSLCRTACKQHKLPDEKTFRHQICPNTKSN